MARVIDNAVNRVDWDKKLAACQATLKKYTWQRSATVMSNKLAEKKLQKLPGQNMRLVLPNPKHDSPAAQLGEQLYMRLQRDDNISLSFLDNKPTDRPSYVGYLPVGQSSGPPLIVRNKSSIFNRSNKKVIITYKSENTNNALTLNAKRQVLDSALGISAWEFYDETGKLLTLTSIIDIITGE